MYTLKTELPEFSSSTIKAKICDHIKEIRQFQVVFHVI